LLSEGIEEQEAAQHMSRGHLLLLFSTIMDTVASDNVSALKMSHQHNYGVRTKDSATECAWQTETVAEDGAPDAQACVANVLLMCF